MRIHFIAIGGSAMHNLAIALANYGDQVTGSDDEIREPSLTRLKNKNILPDYIGWKEEMIHSELDAVIVGMHARKDNPELLKAQALGIKIYSYPEFIYEQTKNKKRLVIGGSHGKTTITSMLLHVLNYHRIKHDYMVGAQLEGYDCMVGFDPESKIAVIEGDEYLSSPHDLRPKFHLYHPNVALLSGIAWDHINVFPTFENYVEQFSLFIDLISENGALIYFKNDVELQKIANTHGKNIRKFPYESIDHVIENGITYILNNGKKIPLKIFGDHNIQNLAGALLMAREIGISEDDFYAAIQSFKGASKRLELVKQNELTVIYKDFAHSPSKLKATTLAVKKQFPNRELIACMELHTFSSLNENFLKEYKGSMSVADEAIVYFNPATIAHKKLKPITEEQVQSAFNSNNIHVFTNSAELVNYLKSKNWSNKNLLLMSSGNFDGVNFENLADELIA